MDLQDRPHLTVVKGAPPSELVGESDVIWARAEYRIEHPSGVTEVYQGPWELYGPPNDRALQLLERLNRWLTPLGWVLIGAALMLLALGLARATLPA